MPYASSGDVPSATEQTAQGGHCRHSTAPFTYRVTHLLLPGKGGHMVFLALSLVTWAQPARSGGYKEPFLAGKGYAAQIFGGGEKTLWFLWYFADDQKKPDF